MNKLEEARKQISLIDSKMLELFEKRMHAVALVAEYKKENHLSILDSSREQFLMEQNVSLLKDKDLEHFYRIFFEGVLCSSKEYQKEILK